MTSRFTAQQAQALYTQKRIDRFTEFIDNSYNDVIDQLKHFIKEGQGSVFSYNRSHIDDEMWDYVKEMLSEDGYTVSLAPADGWVLIRWD